MSDFDEYQRGTRFTAVYPDAGTGDMSALMYTALGLAGETGEVADKVKKIYRDKGGVVDALDRAALSKELGDVQWYLARVADELNLSLGAVVGLNERKLRDRKTRGVLGGSGDDR
ncbi:nucleoside triphosphate pyrophosphohydrolase family protein [Amycolatopsis sp. NPDC059027]|uniref:nucleoside triphosphate pyrophosphohydrolase family protein n=1 Tax=Amycolatopsis sp. NPDC059027 TaxID=3346709 RepID=UPI00366AEB8C